MTSLSEILSNGEIDTHNKQVFRGNKVNKEDLETVFVIHRAYLQQKKIRAARNKAAVEGKARKNIYKPAIQIRSASAIYSTHFSWVDWFNKRKIQEFKFFFVTFCRTGFSNTDLTKAYFYQCTFTNIHFNHTIFKQTHFEECTFIRCNFGDANVEDVRLDNCNFLKCFDHPVMNNTKRKKRLAYIPPTGSFIGWKKVYRMTRKGWDTYYQCDEKGKEIEMRKRRLVKTPFILKLEISGKRHMSPDDDPDQFHYRKCRAERAKVLSAFSMNGKRTTHREFRSSWGKQIIYRVGKIVHPDSFDECAVTCSHGIHFYLTQEEAMNHN